MVAYDSACTSGAWKGMAQHGETFEASGISNPSRNLASLEVPLGALKLPLKLNLGVEQHLLGLLEVAQPATCLGSV